MLAILLEAPSSTSQYSNLILLGGLAIVFYFFMIRPQQKKAKEAKNFIEEIKVGDTIITIGGIHGTLIEKNDLTAVVEIARGFKITIERAAISVESTKRLKAVAEKAKA
jgi:preprotein translocase subunit YajC